jgi:hypothetical protein
MFRAGQPILPDIFEQPEPKPQHRQLKPRPVDRRQTILARIRVKDFVGADHQASAILELARRWIYPRSRGLYEPPRAAPAGRRGTAIAGESYAFSWKP